MNADGRGGARGNNPNSCHVLDFNTQHDKGDVTRVPPRPLLCGQEESDPTVQVTRPRDPEKRKTVYDIKQILRLSDPRFLPYRRIIIFPTK